VVNQGIAQVGAVVGGAALGGALGGGGTASGTAGYGGAATTTPYAAGNYAGGAITGSAIPGVTSGVTAANAAAAGIGPAAAGGATAGATGLSRWLSPATTGFNALLGAHTANQAMDAEENALNAAIEEQRRQYDLTRADWAPWMETGRDALNQMSDPRTHFEASPDYEWRRNEGERDIGNSFAARGGAASGNALRALTEFNSGLASGEFENWFNRQGVRAGLGSTGTGSVTNAGVNTANNVSGYTADRGASRSSGIWNRNASIGQGLQDGVNNWLYRRRVA
jgi:hypothetical protein